MAKEFSRRHRARVCCFSMAVAFAAAACTGEVPDRDPLRPGESAGAGGGAGTPRGTGGAQSGAGGGTGGAGGASADPSRPGVACEPVLDRRVTRLSDRHLANALGTLLNVSPPELETGALAETAFLAGKPAPVTGAVATKLQDFVEAVARAATATGKPAIACTGSETECARAFVEKLGSRAFRRPLTDQERTELMAVYTSGRSLAGTHAGGISLVMEAVLQSPSFIYLSELGVAANGQWKLTPYELAAKLSFFLRDNLPDEALWQAASTGKLATDAGLGAEVDRMLGLADTKANLSKMFHRFFDLESLPTMDKGSEVPSWATLSKSLYAESTRFVEDTLWKRNGTLRDLLTSRQAVVDKTMAAFYGVAFTGTDPTLEITLPAEQRAGILTRAGLMAVKAEEHDTSVVFRGLMVARGFLCLEPPSPPDAAGALGEMLRTEIATERGRAEARLQMTACTGCHTMFDPFGVNFEHYDMLGKYRTSIATSKGAVPVNASWDIDLGDIKGTVVNAVDLSQLLGESRGARACFSRQIAAYAVGERLPPAQACTVDGVAQRFEASGGNLRTLIREIALWPGLRNRREGVSP